MSNNRNRWPTLIELQQSAIAPLNPHLFETSAKGRAGGKKTEMNRVVGKYKTHIDQICKAYADPRNLTLYREFQFHPARKFKFDWAFLEIKVAIEYEGIHSAKSGHTTIKGFNKDVEKYNAAIELGWEVLRYTANTYENIERDLEVIKKRRQKHKL